MYSNRAAAQGWSFTFQLASSGPCGNYPLPVIPALPNLGLPTKSYCESFRSILANIKSSGPVYNSEHEYIGTCTIYVNCTECTGSDLNTGAGSIPGEVSVNGLVEGKPFFTPHQSQAFEDWATEYKALLKSYGITSILEKTDFFKFPETGNKKQDKKYKDASDDFDPDVKDDITGSSDVVDLSGKKGIVKSLTSPEEQAARDKWYSDKGFMDFVNASPDGSIDENGDQQAERSWSEAAIRTGIGEAPGLIGVTGSGMVNVVDETMGSVTGVLKDYFNGNESQALEKANTMPSDIVVNSAKKTASDWVSDKIIDISFGPLLKALPGAETLHKYVKLGYDLWENKQGK